MSHGIKVLIGIAALAVLIFFGFIFGKNLQKQNAMEIITAQDSNKTPPVAERTKAVPQTVYTISPPSRGRANFSIPFEIKTLIDGVGEINLPFDQAGKITKEHNILLFDEDGKVMDGIGHILDIRNDARDKQTKLIFEVTNLPNKNDLPARGEIVLHAIPQANRLPLTALQKDREEHYLWEVADNENGLAKTQQRKITNVHVINDTFFIMDTPDYVSNIYVLNPDVNIADAQFIKVQHTLYSPGYIANDTMLAAAPKRIYPDLTLEEQILSGGSSNEGNSCNTSCSTGADAAQEFIDRVKSLAAPATAPTP